MITADRLTCLINYGPEDLEKALRSAGYLPKPFTSCLFLGLTNGWQFCYSAAYFDEEFGEERRIKVFLTWAADRGLVAASY